MKIVFFGTSDFAIPTLRRIISSPHKVVAVVTQPDRKKGRLLKVTPPPTKVLAITKGINVFQPQDVSSAESIKFLKSLDPDMFVVVAFGQILKKDVISIPKIFSINLHGSVLPKYRGASPTNRAIINGDGSSGITIIKMNEKMDEGDIILTKEVVIDEDDTNITLSEKLSDVGADAVMEIIGMAENKKNIDFVKQDERLASYAAKLTKEDGLIKWDNDAKSIRSMVRGLLPWPGAYTYYNGKMVKILNIEVRQDISPDKNARPGQVVDIIKGKGIMVATLDHPIIITHLQLEGKKAMDADSFVRGHRVEPGHRFTGGK